MSYKYLLPAFLLGFAACETVPVEEPPVLMEAAAFDEVFARAQANPSPPSADRALTDLLNRADLTEEQRAEALFLRAEKRRLGNFNLPGAAADYETFLAMRPLDSKAAHATRDLGFTQTSILAAEQRLGTIQTLSEWFDNKVIMGDLPEAAARYESSGLTPTEGQVYILREAGYICATGIGKPVHNHGEMPSYVQDLTWCPQTPVSEPAPAAAS